MMGAVDASPMAVKLRRQSGPMALRSKAAMLTGEVVVVRMHDDEVMLKVFTGIRDDKVVLDSLNSGYDRQLRPLQDVVFIHQVVAKVTSAKIVKAP